MCVCVWMKKTILSFEELIKVVINATSVCDAIPTVWDRSHMTLRLILPVKGHILLMEGEGVENDQNIAHVIC